MAIQQEVGPKSSSLIRDFQTKADAMRIFGAVAILIVATMSLYIDALGIMLDWWPPACKW